MTRNSYGQSTLIMENTLMSPARTWAARPPYPTRPPPGPSHVTGAVHDHRDEWRIRARPCAPHTHAPRTPMRPAHTSIITPGPPHRPQPRPAPGPGRGHDL